MNRPPEARAWRASISGTSVSIVVFELGTASPTRCVDAAIARAYLATPTLVGMASSCDGPSPHALSGKILTST